MKRSDLGNNLKRSIETPSGQKYCKIDVQNLQLGKLYQDVFEKQTGPDYLEE